MTSTILTAMVRFTPSLKQTALVGALAGVLVVTIAWLVNRPIVVLRAPPNSDLRAIGAGNMYFVDDECSLFRAALENPASSLEYVMRLGSGCGRHRVNFTQDGLVRLGGTGRVVRHQGRDARVLAERTLTHAVTDDGAGGAIVAECPGNCRVVHLSPTGVVTLLQGTGLRSVLDVDADENDVFILEDESKSCARQAQRVCKPLTQCGGSFCVEWQTDVERRLFRASRVPRSDMSEVTRGALASSFFLTTHHIAWFTDGALWSVPKSGGVRRKLIDAPETSPFATKGDAIFVGLNNGIFEVPADGAAMSERVELDEVPRGIAVDGDALLFVDGESGLVLRE